MIRCYKMIGSRHRKSSGRRSSRNHDMVGFDNSIADLNCVRRHKTACVAQEVNTALLERLRECPWNMADHLLFARDKGRPVEARRTDLNAMRGRTLDLMQGM